MRTEVTPPTSTPEETERIKQEMKFAGHELRFKTAVLTLRDKRKEFRDLTELGAIWSLIDELEVR